MTAARRGVVGVGRAVCELATWGDRQLWTRLLLESLLDLRKPPPGARFAEALVWFEEEPEHVGAVCVIVGARPAAVYADVALRCERAGFCSLAVEGIRRRLAEARPYRSKREPCRALFLIRGFFYSGMFHRGRDFIRKIQFVAQKSFQPNVRGVGIS